MAHDVADEALDRAFGELADYSAQFSVWGFSLYEHVDGSGGPSVTFPSARSCPARCPPTSVRRERRGASRRVARLQDKATGYALSRPVLARLWRTVARYVEVRVSRLAAFVTYYGFLALFPMAAWGSRSSASCPATCRSSTTPSSAR